MLQCPQPMRGEQVSRHGDLFHEHDERTFMQPPGVRWWWTLSLAAFAVAAIIRGIDRIEDGHAASGWLFLVSGIVMVAGLAHASWRSRSAQRRQA